MVVAHGGTTQKDTTTKDSSGNVLTTTTNQYDAAKRKTAKIDPPAVPNAPAPSGKSNETLYTYDKAGNVTDTKVVNDPQVQTQVTETTTTPDALGLCT